MAKNNARPHTPWLRLWCEMPNDPKWRTIARVSGQPITAVICVYLHLLVNAANAPERGRTQNVCSEDIASALDIETSAVNAICGAMEGRVMTGDLLTGWEKRQPLREDGAAERAKEWREAKKAQKTLASEHEQTRANAGERDANANERQRREEERREEKKEGESAAAPAPAGAPPCLQGQYLEFIKTERPDLVDPEAVYANFRDTRTAKQQTLPAWRVWVRKEHASKEQPSPGEDRNSRAVVEAEGVANGVGKWSEMEQWPVYVARVRAASGVSA